MSVYAALRHAGGADQYLDTERQGRSDPDWGERLALAIHRVGSTATAGQWQPKPEDPA